MSDKWEPMDELEGAAVAVLLGHRPDNGADVAELEATSGGGVVVCYTQDALERVRTIIHIHQAADRWQDATQDMPDA